jgi:acetyl-CoA acetyltransferase
MSADNPFRSVPVAVVGYAQSKVVRRSDEPLGITAIRTAREAIRDAGLTLDQIDGFASSALLPSSGDHHVQDGVSMVTSDWLAKNLGANARYIAGFQGMGQITGSFQMAVNALASGSADYVLFHRALHNPPGKYSTSALTRAAGEMQWGAPQGFFGAIAPIALAYNEYVQRHGASREALARVVVEARKNGARKPWSYWHGKPLTMDDYLAEPCINDPITRLDCDIPVQGVGVYILTRADRARDCPHRPVYVSGAANAYPRHGFIMHWKLDEMMEAGRRIAERLHNEAGIAPGSADLPQVYDAFSPFVFLWMEALGYCPEGEAHRFVLDGGIDSDAPGGLPVVSGGGALGNGRLHGLPQMLEIYLQLSGRAGAAQRQCETGLMAYGAPHFGGGALLFTREPI